jgi:hypothetical protein
VPRQKAYLFIPDDPRLRTWAMQIADARRHSLRKKSEDAEGEGPGPDDGTAFDELRHEEDRGEQLSMFAALSAVVTGDAEESSVFHLDDDTLDRLDRDDATDAATAEDAALDLALPPLPGTTVPAGVNGNGAEGADAPTPREHRLELRARNSRLVMELARKTGLTHAQVNGQLNRLVGLRRIDEATVAQLGRRAKQAEEWLAKA